MFKLIRKRLSVSMLAPVLVAPLSTWIMNKTARPVVD
jgi:hypothetical protein